MPRFCRSVRNFDSATAVVPIMTYTLHYGLGVFEGIRAYHGSPHDFDRFDMSKIGTGEGAQAYGHGLYLAESPAVAGLDPPAGRCVRHIHVDPDQTVEIGRAHV